MIVLYDDKCYNTGSTWSSGDTEIEATRAYETFKAYTIPNESDNLLCNTRSRRFRPADIFHYSSGLGQVNYSLWTSHSPHVNQKF